MAKAVSSARYRCLPFTTARRSNAVAALLCAAPLAQGAAPAPLQVHFQGRPPYSEPGADGSAGGLLARPVRAALERAGITHRWVLTPSQRQLLLIQTGDGLHCGLGWYRSPERERLGKFSRAIYQDRPYVALAREDTTLQQGLTPAEALAEPGLLLLVKEGYSYGPLLDGLISQHAQAVRRTTAENLQMVQMLLAGRAGWMLISPDEAGPLLQQVGKAANQIQMRVLSGVPAGNTRHLYCNHSVPDAWIEAFDRAWTEPR